MTTLMHINCLNEFMWESLAPSFGSAPAAIPRARDAVLDHPGDHEPPQVIAFLGARNIHLWAQLVLEEPARKTIVTGIAMFADTEGSHRLWG